MKKGIALLLSVVLIFGVMTPTVFAATDADTVQPYYLRIRSLAIDFDIGSSGKSTCYCSVDSSVTTDTVDLTMDLQRYVKENGKEYWDTLKTWTSSGTYVASLNKTWYVSSGYEYRLRITAKVYNSSGTLQEMQVDYSDSVYY